MAQTAAAALMTIAIAGMVADDGDLDYITLVAEEDIPFGRVVELDSTGQKCHLPKLAALGKVGGISVYPTTKTPNSVSAANALLNLGGYAAGEEVRVLRKGRIWVETAGTAVGVGVAANVMHASTDGSSQLRNRGKVTASATSATAGAEIDALPTGNGGFGAPAGSTVPSGLVLLEINWP